MKKGILCAIAALLALGGSALATPVTWHLSGWTFEDGGEAIGSFVFDADLGVFSDINITTTAGTLSAGTTYQAAGFFAQLDVLDFLETPLADATGEPDIYAELAEAMTNSGGTIALFYLSLGGFPPAEYICADALCEDGPVVRLLLEGASITTEVVPIPAAAFLFLPGIAGLFAAGRRKRV